MLQMARTPLHIACALEDGQDIEDMLISAGASEGAKDWVRFILLLQASKEMSIIVY